MKKISIIFLSFLICISTTVLFNVQNVHAASGLKVHYIDVGSGDAIYLECDGVNMLIDGGYISQSDRKEDEASRGVLEHLVHNDSQNIVNENDADFISQLRVILKENDNSDVTKYLDSLGVKHINYIVSTHPHYDHIGGLLHVINKYTYDHIYYNGHDYTTRYYRYFKMLADDNVSSGKVRAALQIPQQNDTFQLGSAKVTVLSDQTIDYTMANGTAINNGSIVLRVDYNKRSFLFTGDVQYAAQKKIIETKGSSISNIDVLKVPHHGHTNSVYGNTGHSENYELFAKVNPVISIVQCGIRNTSVSLPTNRVLKDLSMSDVYTTKNQGNIVIECDGNYINVKIKNEIVHGFVKGDINGDGKITPSDYVMVRRQILGTLSLKGNGRVTADINGDGKISPSDYVLIRRHILGTYHIQ